MDTAKFLGSVSLFAGLDASAREHLAKALERKDYHGGENIFYAGDPGDSLLIVVRGAVEVFITDKDSGVEMSLKRFGVGEYLGEMSLVSGDPRSASAKALEDTTLALLTQESFKRVIANVPLVSVALCVELVNRIKRLNEGKGISFVDLSRYKFDADAYGAVPYRLLEVHKAIPVRKENGVLTVAMVNPNNVMAIDDLRRSAGGMSIEPLAVSEDDYQLYLRRHNQRMAGMTSASASQTGRILPIKYVEPHGEVAPNPASEASAPSGDEVVELLNRILAEAIDREASDVHMEPREDALYVRYRVDGRLMARKSVVPLNFATPLVSRVKILSGMDIAEKRMPQDGRISLTRGTSRTDLRVSSSPTSHGEKIVLRVLDPSMLTTGLDRVILASRVCHSVRRLVQSPYGLILVSGPTGSGKTTTLYSVINELDRKVFNVSTIEDPIEYDVSDVTQTQIHHGIGLGFDTMIRTLLRQDPDVMLIGEIRDSATANAAVEAALTGHLVLSSLHTNDAIGVLPRLEDFNVEPFLIANALLGVLNQRLVRKICSHCKVEAPLDGPMKTRLTQVLGEANLPEKIFVGKGCARCGESGYSGRVATFEFLKVGEKFKGLIQASASIKELEEVALEEGMIPMRGYTAFLLNAGLTTPTEAIRVLSTVN